MSGYETIEYPLPYKGTPKNSEHLPLTQRQSDLEHLSSDLEDTPTLALYNASGIVYSYYGSLKNSGVGQWYRVIGVLKAGRGTNEHVVNAWSKGRSAQSHNGNLSTDGHNLYSYAMKIGRTNENGRKQALDVRAEFGYSQTTSCHVGKAARYADDVIEPLVVSKGWSSWRYFPDEINEE